MTKEKGRKIGVPKMQKDGKWITEHVAYEELVAKYKRRIDEAPKVVAAMKGADNEGWQGVLDELTAHAASNPELANLVRRVEKDGREGISIGDPNWVSLEFLLVMNAFFIGYAIGTACFEAGPCDFVS